MKIYFVIWFAFLSVSHLYYAMTATTTRAVISGILAILMAFEAGIVFAKREVDDDTD